MNQAVDWDFFIAHATGDTTTADALYNLLVRKGRVFLATRCVQLGDDWDATIAEAQRASTITVALVSERTSAGYYEREEIAAAIALARRSAGAHRVVPIFLSPEESIQVPIPYGLRLKHGISLGEKGDLQSAAERLLKLLQGIQDREASAFLFANYVSQLTSPNLTETDRRTLLDAINALTGLPDAWYASLDGFVDLSTVPEIVSGIASPGSAERKAFLLGMDLRSFENALRRRGNTALMESLAVQLRDSLNDMRLPPHVSESVVVKIDAALADNTCNGVEDDIVPTIYGSLRARGKARIATTRP